ncbi:MAG: hypothetical protein ACXW15_08295 [Acidimicrobiia bacterium]
MKKPLVLLLFVLALMATACASGSESAGVATLEGSDTTSSTAATPADDQIDTEQAMLNFTQCLRDQGLDIQDPEMDADGNLNFRGLIEGAGEADRAALQAGFEACQSELEGITLGGPGGFDRTAIQDTLIEYAACMRENGYDMEDPDLSNFGPGPSSGGTDEVPGEGVGPFGGIDPNDPAFAAANEVCQEIFTNLGFGQGGGPGGGFIGGGGGEG